MNRRPYGLLVGVAVVMGVAAFAASRISGQPLQDPDGSLGPSWLKMPILLSFAFVIDVLPRSLWRARHHLRDTLSEAKMLVREHWTRPRVALVVIGLTTFYITYVSYRNLKSYLPVLAGNPKDPMLHHIDRLLAFGHEPAVLMHAVLPGSLIAHLLAYVYLLFLPVSPMSLIVFLVWSRNIGYGYWYATSQCVAWALGTVSYYLIPTLGPAFEYPWLYVDMPLTDVAKMQDALWDSRIAVVYPIPFINSVQSVAGFASLHVGIVLTLALIVQYTVRHAWLRRLMWVYLGLTVMSTLYFGWHYISDDIVGALIAVVSVHVGGLATGQRFDRRGHRLPPASTEADRREHAGLVRPG